MFNSKRLAFARRRRGFTKKTLAESVGVSVRSITAYELGETEPTVGTLEDLAKVLDFPLAFFLSDDDIDEIAGDNASFRSLSRMTAGQREAALAAGSLAVRLGRWIDGRFQLPAPSIPDFHEGADPEAAAAHVRSSWGLGERPLSNAVHLLESKGVRVFTLAEECHEVDAFSFWDGPTPYVLLNTQKSAERSRFDAAHELGHLVLHRHGSPTGRSAEEQANAFASAFLMPRSSVIARAPQSPSLRSIVEGKEIWGVSAIAYAFRLHRVNILSDWYYHQLARKMSTLGYRSAEPNSRPRETSQLLKKVFEHLNSSGVTKAEVARQLEISPKEIEKLMFGLIMTGVHGDGQKGQQPSSRDHLRLIKG